MRILELLLQKTESVIRILSRLGSISICAIFTLILGDLLGRNLLNVPIHGTLEICEYFLVILAFACLGPTQLSGKHIRFSLVVALLPKKIQTCLQILVLILTAGLYTIMSLQLAKATYVAWIDKTTHWAADFYLPTWPPNFFACIGCIFLVIAFLIQFVRNITDLVTGRISSSKA